MVHIRSTGTTNSCSAQLGMPLLLQCFLYFFHMAITMACLLPSSDLHDSNTRRPAILGAGHCKPLTPTTLLPSSLTRTILIGYNAVHSLRSFMNVWTIKASLQQLIALSPKSSEGSCNIIGSINLTWWIVTCLKQRPWRTRKKWRGCFCIIYNILLI